NIWQMLPFTTYNIPESIFKETLPSAKWLGIVYGPTLSADDEDLLQKICTALKANYPDDIFKFQLDPLKDTSLSSMNESDLKLVLSFGISPSHLGIWMDINSGGIRHLESFSFILTSTLEELSKSPSAKKQLWSSMKSYLELNQ
ncbi:MAG TPA: hypothetical protein VMZ69_06315, partial [Saprospiraceae bacterium]|nr:hypothetical protein [Saprospiraceae bacterium]